MATRTLNRNQELRNTPALTFSHWLPRQAQTDLKVWMFQPVPSVLMVLAFQSSLNLEEKLLCDHAFSF